jgi:hypothetical protein
VQCNVTRVRRWEGEGLGGEERRSRKGNEKQNLHQGVRSEK